MSATDFLVINLPGDENRLTLTRYTQTNQVAVAIHAGPRLIAWGMQDRANVSIGGTHRRPAMWVGDVAFDLPPDRADDVRALLADRPVAKAVRA